MKNLYIILFLLSPMIYAKNNDVDYIGFSYENDVFVGDDGGYSNGLFASWGYHDLPALDKQNIPSLAAYLADKTYLTSLSNRRYFASYNVGHLFQTASDLTIEELVEEDAPYVGMIGWKGAFGAYDEFIADEIRLTLGWVGPASGAEYVQKGVHELIGSKEPAGWDNQIANELVFNLQAERKWRVFDTQLASTEFDILTGADTSIGNLRSDIGGGVTLRWGKALQSSFARANIKRIEKLDGANYSPLGWYFFTNISADYVFNDIFINGNTFKDSHSVELINEQLSLSAGVMMNIYEMTLLISMLTMSDQYESQTVSSSYGSFIFTYNF